MPARVTEVSLTARVCDGAPDGDAAAVADPPLSSAESMLALLRNQ